MRRYLPPRRLAALRAGKCWWPAEIAMRAVGLLCLLAASRVVLAEHRLAITPVLHDPAPADLGRCALFVALLSFGLMLTLWGPRLLREVDLPGHF